jgi:zinc protease
LPKDLKYPPLRSIQIPNITTTTLPNGMKVSLLEDHELPVVAGMAMVHAGTLLDPPDKIGLAAATGAMLRGGGTAVKSLDQMDNLLDTMAATIDSAADESYTRIGFSSVKENSDTVMALFKEVLTQPGFRQDRIDAVRAQMRAAIAQRNDDPAAMVHRELAGVLYGKDTPFGWTSQYATVNRITSNDLRAFYRRYYFPANVSLAIWGDFDAADMKAAIEKLFEDWKAPAQPAPEFPKVKETPAPGVYLAERKEANQSYYSIGHLGGRVDDKDTAAMQILAMILGGGKRTRLSEKVRTKTGAEDEIRAAWVAGYDHPGLFEISGNTRGVGTVDVLKVILAEIDRIRTTEVTEEELHSAREALLNGIVFAFDTKAKLMGRQLLFDFYGYPKDYLQQYQKALQAVTRADLLRVAKQRINPASLAIVVSANPQMLGEPLEKVASSGVVNRLDLSIPEAKPEPVPSTDASLAEGKQLLQRAQAAMGGAEKLAAVKDFTQRANYKIDGAVPNLGGSTIVETDKWIAPTTLRQDSTLPAGHIAAYTDGRVGWIATVQGWGALIGAQQKQIAGDLFRTWFRLLLSERLEGRTVNAVDSNSVQITDTTGQEAKIEFDPATGLPRRVTYDTPQAMGAPLYSEDTFDDFREVNGIKLPFKITISQSGRKFAEVEVTEYEINSGLKTADLSRRPL